MINESIIELSKKIRDSRWFENFIFGIIIFAGLLVGLETYSEIKSNHSRTLFVLDNLVLWIFVVELIIRTISEIRHPVRLIKNGWYIFDFIIVAVCFIPYLIPDAQTEFLMILRLARVLRMLKLFERVRNLKIILESLLKSIPSMSYVIVLLFLLFYIYGVIGTDLFGAYDKEAFGTLTNSMKTLFFVSFEGWSWVYSDSEGFKAALENGFPDYIIVTYFISFVLLAAMIFLNLFIGILTTEISESKLEDSSNRKKISNKNHTLILGWSQHVLGIVENLVIANESEESSSIVILSDRNKEQILEDISIHVPDTKFTKIYCRQGSPTNIEHLRLVKPEEAKSIIILSDNNHSKHSGINTIKQIIALMNLKTDSSYFNIIADFDDAENAQLAQSLAGGAACIISTSEMIGRIIAQAAVNSGLSKVYNEIIGFAGSEFYVKYEPRLVGKTFSDILFMYSECIPIGIYRNDNMLLINPEPETIFEKDDSVIILSQDDSTINLSQSNDKIDRYFDSISIENVEKKKLENVLILGWNSKGVLILDELFTYLPVNSIVKIISDSKKLIVDCSKYQDRVEIEHNDILTRKDVMNLNLQKYDHLVILSNINSNSDFQESDANTLIKLIHIKNLQSELNIDLNIAVEFLDRSNQQLAAKFVNGDFIVGPDIVSAFIAQISEQREIYNVYDELLSNEGNEIYIKPICNYCIPDTTIDFYGLTRAAYMNQQIAIGLIDSNGNAIINPNKNQTWIATNSMKLIVISEN